VFSIVTAIQAAGLIQLIDAAANLALPSKIRIRDDLNRLSPLARQIFVVHWGYIIYVLAAFGFLCLFFAPDLAGTSALGRFVSGVLAVFWLPRAFIQAFFFDREFRRNNCPADVAFILSSLLLGMVFSIAALGFGR
jgi:hypothetical protein